LILKNASIKVIASMGALSVSAARLVLNGSNSIETQELMRRLASWMGQRWILPSLVKSRETGLCESRLLAETALKVMTSSKIPMSPMPVGQNLLSD
jgi:hypothetical protein